jgi:hypothetical protein
MFNRVPFKKEHALLLLEESINASAKKTVTVKNLEHLETLDSVTGMWNDEPMCCVGVNTLWHKRGFFWSIFSEKIKYNFVPFFRHAKKSILESQYDRLEVSIPYDMEISKRRAVMLGFKLETERARKFFPDGSDAALYAWVRE